MSDAPRWEVFQHLLTSIAEEMGAILRRSAYSPNIKERLDFSCALFDSTGRMFAQAAHIPVHLGAMPLSVRACLERFTFEPGDVALLNDPFHGGTHLPDITCLSPAFVREGGRFRLAGFSASRAHHADVGGMSPGSMPLSQELFQEGLILPPVRIVRAGEWNEDLLRVLLANVRTPGEREGDLRAQIAAAQRGVERLQTLADRYGVAGVERGARELLEYTERRTRAFLASVPRGRYDFRDSLDDDGIDPSPVEIAVSIRIDADQARVDFSGTSEQRRGNVNAVFAITQSAVHYVFRALLGDDVPSNSGTLGPIEIYAPEGSVVNARPPAAVAAGNVETSQRIVDVLLGALAKALPGAVPAASQGTMNNLTIGGVDPRRGAPFTYYETIGGGAGALPDRDGTSAVHTHMTNTQNTPVEALEFAYPLRVRRYAIRRGSGGRGRFPGGDGVVREVESLVPAHVTILSDRRSIGPYGLSGGEPGAPGRNRILRRGEEAELSGKVSLEVDAGDVVRIETPGGGGYGLEEAEVPSSRSAST